MALVTEDGTGKSDAESYCSVAAADARHTALGNSSWTGDDTAKEQALRKATQFIEGLYRQRWKGSRSTRDQALSWPRYGAIVGGWDVRSTVVPTEVANATADLAVKALSAELAPDLERAVIREKVGPLETEYSEYSSDVKRFRAAEMMLAPFVKGGGINAMLVRT